MPDPRTREFDRLESRGAGPARRGPRVLLVTGLTHWGRGGVQRETIRLVEQLRRLGVPTGILVDRKFPDAPDLAQFELSYPPRGRAPAEIADAIQRFTPDVVHVVGGGVRLMEAADNACNVPWTATVHCVPPFERTGRWFYGENTLHYAARNLRGAVSRMRWQRFLSHGRFARLICHSPVIIDQARTCGCPSERLVEIPLGCERINIPARAGRLNADSIFGETPGPRVLTFSAMVHHKGVHDLVRAIPGLLKEFPFLRYRVMGENREPTYTRWLMRLIERENLSANVKLITDVSEDQRLTAMLEADVYAQPSHEEGFCLSFIEAAMLTPRLVGTRTGAMPRVAESAGNAGHIAEPGDVAGLVEGVRRVLATRVTPLEIARRREELLRAFSWEAHAQAHLDLYERLSGTTLDVTRRAA